MGTTIVSKVIRARKLSASFRNPKASLRVCGKLEERGLRHICSINHRLGHDWRRVGFTLVVQFNGSGSTALVSADARGKTASVDVRWNGNGPYAALEREAEEVAEIFAAVFKDRS